MSQVGSRLYALYDKQLKGFITWMEKGAGAIILFTSGEKAERYATLVYPTRPLVVYIIDKRRAADFVHSMINAGIHYALIDVPPEHADTTQEYTDEQIRDYALVSLVTVRARMR